MKISIEIEIKIPIISASFEHRVIPPTHIKRARMTLCQTVCYIIKLNISLTTLTAVPWPSLTVVSTGCCSVEVRDTTGSPGGEQRRGEERRGGQQLSDWWVVSRELLWSYHKENNNISKEIWRRRKIFLKIISIKFYEFHKVVDCVPTKIQSLNNEKNIKLLLYEEENLLGL